MKKFVVLVCVLLLLLMATAVYADAGAPFASGGKDGIVFPEPRDPGSPGNVLKPVKPILPVVPECPEDGATVSYWEPPDCSWFRK